MRFHAVCGWVGAVHIVLGIAIVVWHWRGRRDHKDNLDKIRGAGW